MAFGETAELVALLKLNDQFSGALKNANKTLTGFDANLSRTSTRGYQAGQQIGTGIKNGIKIATVAIGGLVALLVLSAKEGQEAQRVQKIYATAIANSGKVSADYVKALNAQQKALEDLGGVDDELIKSEQTRLIQMGLTGDQILKITPLILDFSKATGVDLLTATKLVGKAVEGNTGALSRYGVIVDKAKAKVDPFTATQDALTKSFGGTTKALSGEFDTRLAALGQHLADIREEAGIRLLPALTKITDVVGRRLVPAFGELINAILPSAIAGLDKLAGFLESGGASDTIDSLLKTVRDLAPIIQTSAEITGRVITTAVNLFKSLPPEIQSLAIAGLAINKLTGGLVTNIAGGLLSAVLGQLRSAVVNIAAANVNVVGGGGIPGVAPTGGPGVVGTIAKAIIPVAIVTIGAEAALQFSGIFQPNHQFTDPDTGQTRVFRGTNVLSERILNVQKNIAALEGRALAGDRVAQRQLADQRALLARLLSTNNRQTGIEDRSHDAIEKLRGEARRTTVAIQRKALSVNINQTVKQFTYVNGRLFNAATARYLSSIDTRFPNLN
jgi:hypothetical protein